MFGVDSVHETPKKRPKETHQLKCYVYNKKDNSLNSLNDKNYIDPFGTILFSTTLSLSVNFDHSTLKLHFLIILMTV